MPKKILFLFTLIPLVFLCAFSACAEDAHYQTLDDLYTQALAAEEESINDEDALGFYRQLVNYYNNSMDQQSRDYSDAEYYYYYASGRVHFSEEKYVDALECFEEHLRNAGQSGDKWLNLDFYCDYCEGMYWLSDGDAETALPLFVQAKSENPGAAKLCGNRIDECKELLIQAINKACARQDFDKALALCALIEANVSKITANELKKTVSAYQENSNIRWISSSSAQTGIDLAWAGGVPPYTVSWSEDLRENAVMNSLPSVNDLSVALRDLFPGTAYRADVRDSIGNAAGVITVKTEPAPEYLLEETPVECQGTSVRSLDLSFYSFTRSRQPTTNLFSMPVNYPTYAPRVEGGQVLNRRKILDGTLGYYVAVDTNIHSQLVQLENQPIRMILHLNGLGTVSMESGTVGDAWNCIQDYMIAFTIHQVLAEGLRVYAPTEEGISWSLDILVNGNFIANVEGKI